MATRTWLGNAIDVKQVSTITLGGTWLATETILVTINGKSLILTVGTTVDTTTIADALSRAINASDTTDNLEDDESRNVGGQSIAEFTEITATFLANVVTLTAKTAGKPFTVATTETSASGTVADATSTAATGRQFWDDTDNWSASTVPVDGDTVVFDRGDVSCLYNIDTGIQPAELRIMKSYEGKIGLADINRDNTAHIYAEYRDTHLKLANDAGTSTTNINIGQGAGSGSQRIRLDNNTIAGTVNINIYGCGNRERAEVPVIDIADDASSATPTISIMAGDVAIARGASDTFHTTGTVSVRGQNARLLIGANATLTSATVDVFAGSVDSHTALSTLNVHGGTIVVDTGAHTTVNCWGGTVDYRSAGTITTLNIGGTGTVTFDNDGRSRTVMNANIFAGATLLDNMKTVIWTNHIDVEYCAVTDVILRTGKHQTITPSAA